MSLSACVFVLTFLTPSSGFLRFPDSRESRANGTMYPPCPTTLSGLPSSPTNVRLTSTNMDLVLRWDPPEGACSGLTYTTRLWSPASGYRPGCLNISALQCDFTSIISPYGIYTGEVQALWGTASSDWEKSEEFIVDRETIIGPPSVTLLSSGGKLEVFIKDPVFKNTTLQQVYHRVTYNITYWREGEGKKTTSITQIQQNRKVLDELDPLSKYCVQVQINTVRNPRPSKASSIVCESTSSEKEAPWLAAVVVCVVLAMVVSLVVVLVLKWNNISQFLFPKDALMCNYPESLLKVSESSRFLAMPSMEPVEEISHKVTVEERGLVEAADSS
ncbi:interleukin-10 receptor subunit beta-like [Melanotaenia boesemani]|uniref:interleukin-10 receptor subunit beta-like n=1 Tax=Melanotaenia boesemani TaxID=1250792 RepID=UPI001C046F7A|nr:interleukin-10 receptor subunit beta-like [Melanotaenia boesemani]